MRITLLKMENFQRTKLIEIRPGDRNLVLIAGKNRQGKSSLLRAMSAALGGGKEKPERPVREGEETAAIVVELDGGELVISKTFSAAGKATLEVRSSALGKVSSPQRILDGIVGTRFLDPLAFTRLSEKQQREKLLEVVDLGIDLDDNAIRRKAAFAQRTEVNRTVKRLTAEYEALDFPDDIPPRKDLQALLGKLEDFQAQDAKAVDATKTIEDMERQVREAGVEVDRLEKLITIAQGTLAQVTQDLSDQHAELTAVADVDVAKDIIDVREELAQVDNHNTVVAGLETVKASKLRVGADLTDAMSTAKNFDDGLKALDKVKADALASAKMPVDGLSLGESSVLLNNVPLSQASGAEQLQLSLAIAASTSPELRDIWIEDGALLDGDSLKLVSDFASEHDLRVWLERVGETDDDCIVIEDGMVRAESND